MRNRKELRDARAKAARAAAEVEWIEALPRRRGELVVWDNGVVWQRAGDDAWIPIAHAGGEADTIEREPYSSAHVASWAGTRPTSDAGDQV